MPKTRHPTVVLHKEPSVPALIAQGRGIVHAIDSHREYFPAPTPPLDVVTGHLDTLENSQAKASLKTVGAIEERDEAQLVVENDLKGLVACVQAAVTARPEHAEAIASAANLALKVVGVRNVPPLEALAGAEPGSVDLVAHNSAKKGQRVFHEWSYSLDNGITWLEARPTTLARTTIGNLPRLSSVSFRHRVSDSSGPLEWSPVVTFVVG